jgi:hypothetical protein
MPWDQVWVQLHPYIPSLETGGIFIAVVVCYFLVQRFTGIRNLPRVVVRDLAIVGVLWLSATALVLAEPDHHWLQRGASWIVDLL